MDGSAAAAVGPPKAPRSTGPRCRSCCAGAKCHTPTNTSSRSRPTNRWRTSCSVPLHRRTKTEAHRLCAADHACRPVRRYYWQIMPVDATGHRGTPSSIAKFSWAWPTTTSTVNHTAQRATRRNAARLDTGIQLEPVPGAARYEVEVSSAEGFPPGSTWCCSGSTIGTSASPASALEQQRILLACPRRSTRTATPASGTKGRVHQGLRRRDAHDTESRDERRQRDDALTTGLPQKRRS